MYIWILLATIMVALSFYNVSPRVDKEHALNEVRAATVSNRFKIEHSAMLKTMECEIMYQKNLGCWDAATTPGACQECGPEVTRASATGPVDVSCFNPIYYANNASTCASKNPCSITVGGENGDTMQTFWGNPSQQESSGAEGEIVDTTKTFDEVIVANYNYFTKHVPHGYDTKRGRNVFPRGIHHYIYCLDEVAERATAENFVGCDMRRTSSSPINTEQTNLENENLQENTEGQENSQTTTTHTTEKRLTSRTRYLVTFAQIPSKWLSKNDRSPLPVLVNMLAKDNNADTVFGWTVCDGSSTPKCRLYGLNARHGNLRRKEDSRRQKNNTGVSVGIKTHKIDYQRDANNQIIYDEESGKPVLNNERTAVYDYVFEYEKLPDNSVFWQNEAFRENCASTPCMFAYERIPAIDTAYHCYNLMVGYNPNYTKSNTWSQKHKDQPINTN